MVQVVMLSFIIFFLINVCSGIDVAAGVVIQVACSKHDLNKIEISLIKAINFYTFRGLFVFYKINMITDLQHITDHLSPSSSPRPKKIIFASTRGSKHGPEQFDHTRFKRDPRLQQQAERNLGSRLQNEPQQEAENAL